MTYNVFSGTLNLAQFNFINHWTPIAMWGPRLHYSVDLWIQAYTEGFC